MKGTLIPHTYQVRATYRTDPFYRATFFAAMLGIIAAGITGLSVYSLKGEHDETMVRKAEVEAEEQTIANRRRILRPTMESYAQLEAWKAQRRVAVTPVLTWLEKRMPPEQSITSLAIVLDRITPGVARTGTVSFKLYILPAAGDDDVLATAWLNSAIESFAKCGMSIKETSKSPARDVDGGRVIDVVISFSQSLPVDAKKK